MTGSVVVIMAIKMERQLMIIDVNEEEYCLKSITHWLAVISSVENWLEI